MKEEIRTTPPPPTVDLMAVEIQPDELLAEKDNEVIDEVALKTWGETYAASRVVNVFLESQAEIISEEGNTPGDEPEAARTLLALHTQFINGASDQELTTKAAIILIRLWHRDFGWKEFLNDARIASILPTSKQANETYRTAKIIKDLRSTPISPLGRKG